MSKLSEFASPPYCCNLKHKSTCMHYLFRNCVLSNLQQRNQLSKKVLNPFGLLPLAVLEETIVFVSPSPPLNLSPAAEPHSLPPPARPRQHRAAGGGSSGSSAYLLERNQQICPKDNNQFSRREAGLILLRHGPAATCVDWGRKEVVDNTILLAVQIRSIAAERNPYITVRKERTILQRVPSVQVSSLAGPFIHRAGSIMFKY